MEILEKWVKLRAILENLKILHLFHFTNISHLTSLYNPHNQLLSPQDSCVHGTVSAVSEIICSHVCTDTKTVTPNMWVLIRCYLITVKLQNRLCYDRVVYRENIERGGGHLMHLMHLNYHPSQSSILIPHPSSLIIPHPSSLSSQVLELK